MNRVADAMTYACYMRVSELCIMVSFGILHILQLFMRITTYDFDSCIIFAKLLDRWWSAQ